MTAFGGIWSETKLKCVEDYTKTYLQVMQAQLWCSLHYVDGFAGSGTQHLPDSPANGMAGFFDDDELAGTREFLDGSAIRALRASEGASRGFDQHIFIERGKKTCASLKERVAVDHPRLLPASQFLCGDANELLCKYVEEQNWAATRSLVFLDPYGTEVSWGTVAALAATQACDVWYLFPLGGVMRLLTNSGDIPDSWADRLTSSLGTDEWRTEFYQTTKTLTLFDGYEQSVHRDASTDHVVDYVRGRLQTLFPAVAKPAVLRNSKGAPLFALFLCVANPSEKARAAALGIANHLTKGLTLA